MTAGIQQVELSGNEYTSRTEAVNELRNKVKKEQELCDQTNRKVGRAPETLENVDRELSLNLEKCSKLLTLVCNEDGTLKVADGSDGIVDALFVKKAQRTIVPDYQDVDISLARMKALLDMNEVLREFREIGLDYINLTSRAANPVVWSSLLRKHDKTSGFNLVERLVRNYTKLIKLESGNKLKDSTELQELDKLLKRTERLARPQLIDIFLLKNTEFFSEFSLFAERYYEFLKYYSKVLRS